MDSKGYYYAIIYDTLSTSSSLGIIHISLVYARFTPEDKEDEVRAAFHTWLEKI